MTVHELIGILKGFNQDAIVLREEKDFSSDYELKTVVMYGTDSEHVFLEFDDQDDCENEDDCNSKDLNNKNTTTKGGLID